MTGLIPLRNYITRVETGRSVGPAAPPAKESEWGVIRVSAMTWGSFRPEENKRIPQELANPRFEIRSGDLLVSRANTNDYVGAPVVVGATRPRLLLSDKSLRLVPHGGVDARWISYMLRSPAARGQIEERASGTSDSMRNISQAALLAVGLPVCDIAEQRRVVALLDEHFSRLDAAGNLLARAKMRRSALVRSLLERIVPDDVRPGWRPITVAEAGRTQLGRARHPDWHQGPEMRQYLRVANVFEDRIDDSDVMSMDFSGVFEKYRLHNGDILLNEGQSPHLLGRPAIYRGKPSDVGFTNSLIRFQANTDVLPEWALLVFRRHMHSGRFRRESRITTNIAHLSMARLRTVEFPVPPIAEQALRITQAQAAFDGIGRLNREVDGSVRRSAALRRGLLEAAFTGRLTGKSLDLEIAEELADARGAMA